MVGRIVVGLALAVGVAFAVGCDSNESSADDDDSNDDSDCRIATTLSGGLEKSFSDEAPACAYTARTVSFILVTGEGPAASLLLSIDDFEANQTGSFAASIEINRGSERWHGATCNVTIESNVKTESASDGGAMFDRYLVKGNGSCSTPANYAGVAGGKAPVTIAPFTFVAPMLFY